jgi:hypothetical protein
MKTVTLPLEFVKEAYKAACNDWKQRIEEHVPELAKPKLEVGKWYKGNVYNIGTLICIKEIKMDLNFKGSISQNHYGFIEGCWVENQSWSNTSFSKDLIPATDKEVEDALIKEAKRRGFKEGANVISFFGFNYNLVLISKFEFVNNILKVWGEQKSDGVEKHKGYFKIFHNGKWAEIIQNPIPKKLQKLIDEYGKEKIKEMLS